MESGGSNAEGNGESKAKATAKATEKAMRKFEIAYQLRSELNWSATICRFFEPTFERRTLSFYYF